MSPTGKGLVIGLSILRKLFRSASRLPREVFPYCVELLTACRTILHENALDPNASHQAHPADQLIEEVNDFLVEYSKPDVKFDVQDFQERLKKLKITIDIDLDKLHTKEKEKSNLKAKIDKISFKLPSFADTKSVDVEVVLLNQETFENRSTGSVYNQRPGDTIDLLLLSLLIQRLFRGALSLQKNPHFFRHDQIKDLHDSAGPVNPLPFTETLERLVEGRKTDPTDPLSLYCVVDRWTYPRLLLKTSPQRAFTSLLFHGERIVMKEITGKLVSSNDQEMARSTYTIKPKSWVVEESRLSWLELLELIKQKLQQDGSAVEAIPLPASNLDSQLNDSMELIHDADSLAVSSSRCGDSSETLVELPESSLQKTGFSDRHHAKKRNDEKNHLGVASAHERADVSCSTSRAQGSLHRSSSPLSTSTRFRSSSRRSKSSPGDASKDLSRIQQSPDPSHKIPNRRTAVQSALSSQSAQEAARPSTPLTRGRQNAIGNAPKKGDTTLQGLDSRGGVIHNKSIRTASRHDDEGDDGFAENLQGTTPSRAISDGLTGNPAPCVGNLAPADATVAVTASHFTPQSNQVQTHLAWDARPNDPNSDSAGGIFGSKCQNPQTSLNLNTNVFDHLSPLDIVIAGRTSKSWRSGVDAYFASSFAQLMRRYFMPQEVLKFRFFQEKQGAIISGSSVIQFFERTVIEDSTLDVYVEHQNALRLGSFLEEIGYKLFDLAQSSDENPSPKFTEVFKRFDKLARKHTQYSMHSFKKKQRTIQLIMTKGPVMEVILSFPSSALLNIITHSHAYSLYPKATFVRKVSLVLRPAQRPEDVKRNEDAQAKCLSRGWKLLPHVSFYEATHPQCEFSAGPRWVGDAKCMTVRLPSSGAGPSPNPYAWSSNSWRLEFDSKLDDTPRMNCGDTYVVDKRSYCIAEKGFEAVLEIPEVKMLMDKTHCSKDIMIGIVAAHYFQSLARVKDAVEWFQKLEPHWSTSLFAEILERTQV